MSREIKECQECKTKPYSLADQEYLRIFGNCWTCDRKKWDAGELSLEEFEKRETKAFDSAEEKLSQTMREGF
jgi:hypothetical protein